MLAGAGAGLLPACGRRSALDAQVVILGAGLAGLYAAMLLEAEGYDVVVLEALPRVGGRMMTIDHADGFTEGGGQQIGANYARVLDVADRLGVALYSGAAPAHGTAHYLNDEWSDGTVVVPQFPEPFRETSPGSVLFRLVAAEPGFEDAESWRDAGAKFDMSAEQFLAERGFDEAARALIDRTLNGNSLNSYSMLNLFRTSQLYSQSRGMGPSRYVSGGSQRLPEAMAASLSRPVRLETIVRDIRPNADGVVVRTGSGPIRAEWAVCTLPFPVLRTMPGLMGLAPQAEAIRALPYTQIRQFHMRTERPFWSEDGLGANSWTDTACERIFADTDREKASTGYLRGWVNGDGTAAWRDGDAANRYAERFGTIRPAAKGALTPVAAVDWTRTNPHAGGAYAHWAPGQVRRFAGTMGDPIGRLHFAGEHVGVLHTGMEAAMESAERASLAILEGVV
ncbi:MAG: FAD-dependent oxidoreductase [Litorimonas sp.]